MRLCDLPLNTRAKVVDLDESDRLTRRIMDLGLEKGMTVTALFQSPFGDPTAYAVADTVIALRRTDCQNIGVKLERQ